jgi:hypothetical protein
MPSEWLGVHGGRSYGPSPRGSSLPGPAVLCLRIPWHMQHDEMDSKPRMIYNIYHIYIYASGTTTSATAPAAKQNTITDSSTASDRCMMCSSLESSHVVWQLVALLLPLALACAAVVAAGRRRSLRVADGPKINPGHVNYCICSKKAWVLTANLPSPDNSTGYPSPAPTASPRGMQIARPPSTCPCA